MNIYIIAMSISICLAWILTSKNVVIGHIWRGKITPIRITIAFLPLFLLALFRWNVGVDVVYGSGYYYQEYEAISSGLGNILNYEKGFYLLMLICNKLGMNLYLFYCVTTIIFFGFVIYFINRNCKHIAFCILIFVLSDLYLFSFSTLRQSLAIAIFLYPLSEFINKKECFKNWKWWCTTAIAMSMHTSIIYLLIVLFVSKIRFKKRTLLCIIILGTLLSPVINIIFSKLITYTVYFTKYFGSNEFKSEFTPTYFIISLIVFIPVYMNYNRLIKEKGVYLLINISAFVVFLMLNSQILIMPYRIFPLFVPIYLVLCSKLISVLKLKYMRCLYYLYFTIPFAFLFVNQYFIGGGSRYYEYKSIFQFLNQIW